MIPVAKYCSYCKNVRPSECFHNNKARRDGLSVYCIKCSSIRNKIIYARTRKTKICVICKKNFDGLSHATRCSNCRLVRKRKKVDGYRSCKTCGFVFPFRLTLRVRGTGGRIRNGGVGKVGQQYCSKRCALIWKNSTDENKLKVKNARRLNPPRSTKGITRSASVKDKLSKSKLGSKNPNWRNGSSTLEKLIRNNRVYKKWRRTIFERDDFTCQICRKRGERLQADHIKPFSVILRENNIASVKEAMSCKELWDIINGRTLCEACHKDTDTYFRKALYWKNRTTPG